MAISCRVWAMQGTASSVPNNSWRYTRCYLDFAYPGRYKSGLVIHTLLPAHTGVAANHLLYLGDAFSGPRDTPMFDLRSRPKVRFTQLDDDTQQRLRTVYHLTSAQAALKIARSGAIWSNDPDGCPNFSLNRDLKLHYTATPEVALTFKFHGTVRLQDEKVDFTGYEANTLNLHLIEWPTLYGMDGMRIAIARVAAGTVKDLECVDFKLTPAYIERCKTDPSAELLLRRLRRQLALGRMIKVPGSQQERQAFEVRASDAEPTPSLLKSLWGKIMGTAPVE